MRALEEMDEVEKTTVFGTAVHAVLKPADDRSRRRCAIGCRRAGLEIDGIDRVMPSLEDVFLDVVERAS